MNTLLDTNVVSEARRPKPNARVMQRLRELDPQTVYLSSVTFGELTFGVSRLPKGKKRRDLQEWLGRIEQAYGSRILPLDREAARTWGELLAASEAKGRTMPLEDAQIAAIAKRHGLRLYTRNIAHFDGLGVDVLNPWEPD